MKFFFLILSCFIAGAVGAQITDSSFSLVKTYKGDIAGAAVDNLDNLYIISSTGQVKKFGPKGDSIGVFNGIRNYGKLTAIDVTNPLKPLLFYKDFSNVVILDRFLASRSSLNLRKYNILQPSAIGLSYDNNIWVFDTYDNKLKRLDEAGNLLLQTDDFRALFNQSFAPQKIINENGFVYLADSASGIFVFDNYGTYKRKIPLKNWGTIDVTNGRIVRLSKDAIVVYNPVNFSEKSFAFPSSFKPYLHSFTTSNKLITFSQDSLRIYRIGY
ncbi:hypothetical protein [Flavisolibacter ginsenosidimutans]|uniref:6-bladed beta-propeller n=1 Tax=Flavisolibacter ginsenosidimutans TaxID=661481 RepID=A0A5B8UJB6_9BACT|nr:hypothetical protein [Flavisolibacter ginsenosidimutans]QEC56777.1 hypothetical protein FSB75_13005 [Flavisolibacter ginsenosidimutans]